VGEKKKHIYLCFLVEYRPHKPQTLGSSFERPSGNIRLRKTHPTKNLSFVWEIGQFSRLSEVLDGECDHRSPLYIDDAVVLAMVAYSMCMA